MATIYYGAYTTLQEDDGNWNNVLNWYSNPGDPDSKWSGTPGTRLNRLPLANDTIVIVGHVRSNVGTWSGTIISNQNKYFAKQGILGDPNAIWTGNVSTDVYAAGTFTGRIKSEPNGGEYPVSTKTIAGGTYTSTCVFDTDSYSGTWLAISDSAFSVNNYQTTITYSNPVFQGSKTFKSSHIYINTNITFSNQISFKCETLSINRNMTYDQYQANTFSPTFMCDISTPITGIRDFYIRGDPKFLGAPTLYMGNNTIRCSNLDLTANLNGNYNIVITPGSSGVTFHIYDMWYIPTATPKIIEVPIYLSGPNANSTGSFWLHTFSQDAVYKLSYAPKVTIPVSLNADGTYKIDNSLWPYNIFKFGERFVSISTGGPIGSYTPTVNLSNLPVTTTNLGAILNEY